MSAIFETEFRDLQYTKDGEEHKAKASTCKLLLLAIADHANDYGESAYPGYDRLEIKTALSRQGIADTLQALTQNGLLSISDKPSRLQTNNYTIILSSLPTLKNEIIDESSHLTDTSQATLLGRVKPLDLNHQLTIIKTLGDKSPDLSKMPMDWKLAHGQEITAEDVARMEDDKRKDVANLISIGFGISAKIAFNLAYAFQVARNITFPESKVKGQRKAIKEMLEMHVTPENVTEAVQQLTGKGMTVVDLFSVSKTAIDLANKPKEQYNPNEEHRL